MKDYYLVSTTWTKRDEGAGTNVTCMTDVRIATSQEEALGASISDIQRCIEAMKGYTLSSHHVSILDLDSLQQKLAEERVKP